MVGLYVGYNLPDRSCRKSRKLFSSETAWCWGVAVVPQVKQFTLRLARRSGLPSEIVSALWQKGVHIQAFFVEVEEDQDVFHLAVDRVALAKETFIENGWEAIEEGMLAQALRS